MEQKVILTRGIQGSGKSTWAKAWVKEDPEKRIRINWDDMRNMFGQYWVPSRESLLGVSSNFMLEQALKSGYSVVIDNMNLSKKSTETFLRIAEKYGIKVEYVDFKTPLDICISRDKKRESPIGEDIIRKTYEKYISFYGDKKEEA